MNGETESKRNYMHRYIVEQCHWQCDYCMLNSKTALKRKKEQIQNFVFKMILTEFVDDANT